MEKFQFDLKHTNIAKGLFILTMVFHHVFAPDMAPFLTMGTGELLPFMLTQIGLYCKVCVGGFAFLSAYGISKKLLSQSFDVKNCSNVYITRFTKFYFSFWPIFLIGIIGTALFGETPLNITYVNQSNGIFSWVLPIVDGLGLANLVGSPTINMSWWYITVAFFIILATPLYHHLYERFRFSFLFVMCTLPYALEIEETTLILAVPALGVAFAKENWLPRLKAFGHSKWWTRILQWIVPIILIMATLELRKSSTALKLLPICTVIFMYFSFVCISDVPVLRNILGFFGKHSANIFFVHTFLYHYWFTYTIYSVKNRVLIYCIVFFAALLISIIVELIKKLMRYHKFESLVITHLNNLICKKDS